MNLDPPLVDRLRQAVLRLHAALRMSLPALEEDASGLRVRNLIGAIDLGDGIILDVEPKTRPGEDWVRSVLSLLVGDDPADAAGDRSGSQDMARPDLMEAIAAIYAARLERALRREGPLLTMRRTSQRGAVFKGKLDVDRWLEGVFCKPAQFPVSYDVLTADNEFTSALTYVCHVLKASSRNARTRARLTQLSSMLRLGLPPMALPSPGVERRLLPPQWAVYRPAWAIACAMLARRSLLGPTGRLAGISIAIEAWPLLERLLERSIAAAVDLGPSRGRSFFAPAKATTPLLVRSAKTGREFHELEPDGLLQEDGAIAIAFEAKYRDFDPRSGPLRGEVYQALAAARAVSAPVSVLVYPNQFETISWSVSGAGSPSRLFAIGLDLFGYVRGREVDRGRELLKCLDAKACVAAKIA